MERWLVIELGAAIGGTALLATLGWLMQRRRLSGVVLVGMAAAQGAGLCILTTFIGRLLAGNLGGWIGLIAGMALSAVLFPPRLAKFVKAHSAWPFVAAWLTICALCVVGYLLGDWPGLAMVPFATIVIMLWLLHRFAKYVLPLQDVKKQQFEAFRCMLTYLLGTNWPFYFLKDGKAKKRVDGDPFRQFFAGPGLLNLEPDYAAYVTDTVKLKGIYGPGLSFIGLHDQEVVPLDLRPQFRAFPVEALTKDGIRLRVMVYLSFRLRCGSEVPKLGSSFPYRQRTIQQVAQHELVERKREKTEEAERHTWNGTLVPLLARPILQEIVGRYTLDDLCPPVDVDEKPDQHPREKIEEEVRRRLRRALTDYGVDLLGETIGNLEPQDDGVKQRRLDNWKTEWEHRILESMSKGWSERAQHIEKARAQAELQILHRLAQAARERGLGDTESQVALTLRFIDCMGEIVSDAGAQWPLPEGCQETLTRLRGEIAGEQR